ncbi:MAG: glucokinase [Chlamydiota bacterium]|jgi:glucokinase
MILAADIGGTKTRLALFDLSGNILRQEKFASAAFSDFNSLIHSFLPKREGIVSACLGIAGPVRDRMCKATNLPWEVSSDALEKEMGIPVVHLINDLEANAWGIKMLKEEEFYTVNQGKKREGNQALISAGTGLGEAGIYWDGKKHHPFACEGGHCDFGPTTEQELDLFVYMMKKYGHVSYERVISGQGLVDIYEFLGGKDKTPEMITKEGCPLCIKSCELFVSLYGSESSNAALKFFALGGVFLGGGIAPHLIDFFKQDIFMKAFLNKGRFASLLSEIPVKILLNDKAALLGAFLFAREYES